MYINKTILILEDNLKILSRLLDKLFDLENNQPYQLSVMILTNSDQVKEYINSNSDAQFDIILLDRDCKLGGSFHILDIERFGPEKVIAISTVSEYNDDAKLRGVTKVVLKDQMHIDTFVKKVVWEVEKMITPSRIMRFRAKFSRKKTK